MKKQRKQATTRKKKTTTTNTTPAPTTNRRALLRNGAIGLGVLGIGGYFAGTSFAASLAERDLSLVGQGTPMVVQVHDHQCGSCIALERETRAALEGFEDNQLGYLIADLSSEEGGTFAAIYGASRVTLLIFDADGQLIHRHTGE